MEALTLAGEAALQYAKACVDDEKVLVEYADLAAKVSTTPLHAPASVPAAATAPDSAAVVEESRRASRGCYQNIGNIPAEVLAPSPHQSGHRKRPRVAQGQRVLRPLPLRPPIGLRCRWFVFRLHLCYVVSSSKFDHVNSAVRRSVFTGPQGPHGQLSSCSSYVLMRLCLFVCFASLSLYLC